jgi:hypothetical protein
MLHECANTAESHRWVSVICFRIFNRAERSMVIAREEAQGRCVKQRREQTTCSGLSMVRAHIQVWINYDGTNSMDSPSGSAVARCPEFIHFRSYCRTRHSGTDLESRVKTRSSMSKTAIEDQINQLRCATVGRVSQQWRIM